jgi:hypothetical protein
VRTLDHAALKANFACLKGTIGCDEVAQLEVALRQEGGKLRGSCPLPDHGGTSPSFYCYPNERGFYDRWWCHRCSIGGDVVDLYAAMEGPFRNAVDALRALADRFGLKLWRPEDLMSDEQLAAMRARKKVEAVRDRALTEWYFEREVIPLARAIEDEAERRAFLENALKEAGLVRR